MLRYEVRDSDNVVIRLFSRREEAEYFCRLDKELCVRVLRRKRKQTVDLLALLGSALF